MTNDQITSALQGRQHPMMSALFSHSPAQLQRMAGEVIPFPVDPRISDMRRIRHEDFMQDLNNRLGQPGVDMYRQMWPAAPVQLGPGAKE